MKNLCKLLFLALAFLSSDMSAQNSVAREWNELNLNAIRNDFARPTVTARNLYHVSAGMYDAWSAYDLIPRTFFLGQSVNGYTIPYEGVIIPTDEAEREAAREMAISYAAYRILYHRYFNLPSTNEIAVLASFDNLMTELGYSTDVTSVDYVNDGPAALGNYIAEQIIAYGFTDGSNEGDGYDNQYYDPVNEPLVTQFDGNPDISDPNRWQPLTLIVAIDQAGNPLPINTPDFLSPEWGNVTPFSLTEEDNVLYSRDENYYKVYCDPGPPAYLDTVNHETGLSDDYKWNHAMVAVWSSLLAHDDGVMIDASPNNIGNAGEYPATTDPADLEQFYNYFDGLDSSEGYEVNPHTGMPYDTQMVPMGDYGRVLAEFWADGPDSETPPGHWFTILNYVNDNPLLEKKWNGQGPELSDLEWDIKTYFAMGGAMHDCAIAAWGIKGWYDYVRPISAIRYMGDQGQSSDSTLASYSKEGLPLIDGYIELVDESDPLVGLSQENLNKVKIMAWKGPDFLDQLSLSGSLIDGVQDSTIAGVGWVLSENWWPYQRPSFVSPPFAGYVSGHSTYSRAAAQVLESATGDAYFPGGMGVFEAPQNDFLVFETGPSVGMELQWAKYKDASDQCSLSRIFGGIHPPVDDIPGRKIGKKIGDRVFDLVNFYANPEEPRVYTYSITSEFINDAFTGTDVTIEVTYNQEMDQLAIPQLDFEENLNGALTVINEGWTDMSTYFWTFSTADTGVAFDNVSPTVTAGQALDGTLQEESELIDLFTIDTENPTVANSAFSSAILNEAVVGMNINHIVSFSETVQVTEPMITFTNDDPTVNSLMLQETQPGWISETQYGIAYELLDADEELYNMEFDVMNIIDMAGNAIEVNSGTVSSIIDTKIPTLIETSVSDVIVNESDAMVEGFSISATYDDNMGETPVPVLTFPMEDPATSLVLNTEASGVSTSDTYTFVFDVIDEDLELADIDVNITGLTDDAGNASADLMVTDLFSIDTKAPTAVTTSSMMLITDAETGGQLIITSEFDEPMDQTIVTQSTFDPTIPTSLTVNAASAWLSETSSQEIYDISDQNEETTVDVIVGLASDLAGNVMNPYTLDAPLVVDNQNPSAIVTANTYNVTEMNEGTSGFEVFVLFDEEVSSETVPVLTFSDEDPSASLTLNETASDWFGNAYRFSFDVSDDLTPLAYIDISLSDAVDAVGNPMIDLELVDYFSIQLDTFLVVEELSFNEIKVFPNPVTSGENFTVELEHISNYEIVMYDQLGRVIEVNSEVSADNTLEVSTSGLSSGKYFIKVRGEESESVLRIEILR